MNEVLVHSRRAFVRSGAIAALAGATGCVGLLDPSDFPSEPVAGTVPQERVDGARSGYVRDVAGPRSDATLAWSTGVGDYVDHSPLLEDSTVFVGATKSHEGVVRALDASNGVVQWTTGFDHGSVSIALYRGGVLASTGFDTVRLSTADGDELNRTAVSGSSSIALEDDRLYVYGTRELHAIPQNFESQGWSIELERGACGPAASGGSVYVGTYDDELLAYARDGTLERRRDVGRDVTGGPTVAYDVVLIGTVDFRVRAISRQSGATIWRHRTGGTIYGAPAVADDTAYVASVDGTVRALDLADGTEQWRYNAGDSLLTGYRAGPVVDPATVFVGGIGGDVTALDRATGDELWSVSVGETPVASPTIGEGYVYVGTVAGNVHAIRGEPP